VLVLALRSFPAELESAISEPYPFALDDNAMDGCPSSKYEVIPLDAQDDERKQRGKGSK